MPKFSRWANPIEAKNEVNSQGNPTGGSVSGIGLMIEWQEGPIVTSMAATDTAASIPNGAFVEDVIEAALQRLNFYQGASEGKFRCRENALAITHLEQALMWLDRRHDERQARGVQGSHTP